MPSSRRACSRTCGSSKTSRWCRACSAGRSRASTHGSTSCSNWWACRAAYRTRYPRQLSGGEQQRVGLARALAADPAIMLMDEPFGAIDAITRARLQDELAEIQRKLRKTIIFVTHDVEEALRLADKIVIMRAGTLVQYDTPLQIIMHPRDTFVRDLTGADDVLRRLSLLSVRDALAAGRNGNGVAATDSAPRSETVQFGRQPARRARAAAALGRPVAAGRRPNGEQLGQLSLDELRGIAQDKETSRQGDKERVS